MWKKGIRVRILVKDTMEWRHPTPKETKGPKLFFKYKVFFLNIKFITRILIFYNRFVIQMSPIIIEYMT